MTCGNIVTTLLLIGVVSAKYKIDASVRTDTAAGGGVIVICNGKGGGTLNLTRVTRRVVRRHRYLQIYLLPGLQFCLLP